jgi:hypothetical protein
MNSEKIRLKKLKALENTLSLINYENLNRLTKTIILEVTIMINLINVLKVIVYILCEFNQIAISTVRWL